MKKGEKRKRKNLKFIEKKEQLVAAKLFCIHELSGQEHLERTKGHVPAAYALLDSDLVDSGQPGAYPTLKSWMTKIRNGDSSCLEEWEDKKNSVKW